MEAVESNIRKAKDILISGGLVAIPTETVYGLAANALDSVAVSKVFQFKGRPNFNPLICHFSDIEKAADYVFMSDLARRAFAKFSPGPLTIVLKKRNDNNRISDLVSAGLDTLAVRIPNHDLTLKLLKELNFPLAAPSANKSNHISPTRASHVEKDFSQEIDSGDIFVLDGDDSVVGLESTIIDLSDPDSPRYLRPGYFSKDTIEKELGIKFIDNNNMDKDLDRVSASVTAPGQLKKHYCPYNYKLNINVNVDEIDPGLPLINFGNDYDELAHQEKVINISPGGDIVEAASNIFKAMHDMEEYCAEKDDKMVVQVVKIPDIGIGVAINDRLKRASS